MTSSLFFPTYLASYQDGNEAFYVCYCYSLYLMYIIILYNNYIIYNNYILYSLYIMLFSVKLTKAKYFQLFVILLLMELRDEKAPEIPDMAFTHFSF